MAFNQVEQRDVVQTGLSGFSRETRPNQSLGILFEGLGAAVSGGLQANEQAIETQLSMDAAEGIDKIASENMPPALETFKGDIEDLVDANGQNALSETAYTTQKADLVRKMTLRFPQYKDKIMSIVSSADGSNATNDVRHSRQQDLARAASDAKAGRSAAEKKYDEKRLFSDANAEILGSPEFGMAYLKATGKKYVPGSMDYDEVTARAIVYNERSYTYKLDAEKRMAELNKSEALPYARKLIAQEIRKSFSTIGNSQLGDFMRKVEAAQASGGDIDPEEMKLLRQGWITIRSVKEAQLKEMLRNPEDKGLMNLTSEQVTQLEGEAMGIYNTYERMFTDKDFGMLNAATNELAQNKAYLTNKVLKENPTLAVYDVFGDILPPDVQMNLWIDPAMKFAQDALLKDYKDAMTGAVITGKASFRQGREAIEEHRDSTKVGVALGESINSIHKTLTSEGVSVDATVAIAKNIYKKENQDVIAMFKYDERMAMLKKLVSPGVVQKIIKSGDQQALAQLENFTTNQFDAITKRMRDTLIDTQVNTNSLQVRYDGNKLVVEMDKGQYYKDLTATALGPLNNANELLMLRQGSIAANELNQFTEMMKPIWEATGQSAPEVLGALMRGQSDVKQGSFFTKMSKAMVDWVSGERDKREGTAPAKPGSANFFEKAARNLPESHLDLLPEAKDKVSQLIENLAARGIEAEIAQGTRSAAEQNALYAQGRTKPGAIVTNARGGKSNHNHKKAVDLVPTELKNRKNWDPENPIWGVIGEEAKKLGLEWGGDWKRKDLPHVQLADNEE